jgi:hypothetical protein
VQRERDNWDNVNNVQYKSNRNCHYQSPLYNEYFLIKKLYKKENVAYIHNGVLFICKEEWNYILCRLMNGTGDHHANWSKPGLEGLIWKMDTKYKCTHKYKHDHIHVYIENMFEIYCAITLGIGGRGLENGREWQ